jgi:lipoprotein-anchoring transpeptidase ErfK/SrfK
MRITAPRRLIAVDRDAHMLKLWKRRRLSGTFKLAKVYRVAVGMAGLATPRGLYVIDDRDYHPSWTMPYADWVPKELQGRTVPYGDPNNPIAGRWLGLKDAAGVGIHGVPESEYDSIGKDASHGCVRMTIPAVEELFPQAPLGTLVYIA